MSCFHITFVDLSAKNCLFFPSLAESSPAEGEGEATTDGAEPPADGEATEAVEEGGEEPAEQTEEQKPEGETGEPGEETSKSPVPQVS